MKTHTMIPDMISRFICATLQAFCAIIGKGPPLSSPIL